jgi:hypothetical protein
MSFTDAVASILHKKPNFQSGALPLLAALLTNTKLRVIDIAGNDNGVHEGCRDVIEVLRSGGKLPMYDEGGNRVPLPSRVEEEAAEAAEAEAKRKEEEEEKQREMDEDAPPKRVKRITPPPVRCF